MRVISARNSSTANNSGPSAQACEKLEGHLPALRPGLRHITSVVTLHCYCHTELAFEATSTQKESVPGGELCKRAGL